MQKLTIQRDPKTGKSVKVLVDLTAAEIAAKEASKTALLADEAAVKADPLQNPLTPPRFHAMVKYIKAQTGQDMDAMIKAAIVTATGGDPDSLPALLGLQEYEKSKQYRYDHPLSVGVASVVIAGGAMTEQQRSDWWLQAAGL